MRILITSICAACSFAAFPQDFSNSAKRFKDKFQFDMEPGEMVVRSWFH